VRYHVSVDGEERWVERIPDGLRVEGCDVEAELHWLGVDEVMVELDGSRHRAFVRRTETGWRIQIRGRTFEIDVEDERAHTIRALAGEARAESGTRDLRAPMPGLVVSVLVEPGQRVEIGDGLVVVEAMKMENELKADGAGTVSAVSTKPGETVDRDDVLVSFLAEDV